MVNHRRRTGLDSIAAHRPRFLDAPTLDSRSPQQSSPYPLLPSSYRQAPGTRHIRWQNCNVLLDDCLSLLAHIQRQFPKV